LSARGFHREQSDVLLESTVEEMRTRPDQGVGHAPTLTDPKHVRIVRDRLLG
jgi:hypothetical protein